MLTGKNGSIAGAFNTTPLGIILHGSRSGRSGKPSAAGRQLEFVGTANYAANEPNGLGWNTTIGEDAIALHMPYSRWGWNARGVSKLYLATEIAQPTEDWPVTDGQVNTICWMFQEARKVWPRLPKNFPTHAELDGTPAYGVFDGKTDVFRKGSPATIALRARIMARLDLLGVA